MSKFIDQPVELTKAGIMNVKITSSCNDQIVQYNTSLQSQSLNTFIILNTLDGYKTKITYINDIFSIIDCNTNQILTKMRYDELINSGLYQGVCNAYKYSLTVSSEWVHDTHQFNCVGYPTKDDFMNSDLYAKFGNMINLTEIEIIELLICGHISVNGINYNIS